MTEHDGLDWRGEFNSAEELQAHLDLLEREALGLPPAPDPAIVEAVRLAVAEALGTKATAAPAPDPARLPALLSKKEAAALLRCSERSIDRLISLSTLRAIRRSLGGSSRVLIERASLLAYLDSIRD